MEAIRTGIRGAGALGLAGLLACGGGELPPVEAAPRAVVVARVERARGDAFDLTGAVHAERETPLAFRIGGQIERRDVSAGEHVVAGQVLMALDPRDVSEQITAAAANLAAAKARTANAEVERVRAEKLIAGSNGIWRGGRDSNPQLPT